VEKHDQEFNISQVPWKKNTRRADISVEGLDPGAQVPKPVELPTESITKAELQEQHCKDAASAAGFYTFLVSPAGNLYLHATADGIIQLDEPMFYVRGNFAQGAAATAQMAKADESWLLLKLDSATLVFGDFKTPVATPAGHADWPKEPQPLGKLLGWLEAAGKVRISLHKHTYARDASQPHKYKVEPEEDLCLQAKVVEDGGRFSLNMMSCWTSIPLLKACPHLMTCYCVKYDEELNKLAVGVPGVVPVKPIRLRANCIYKLF
jgi:hypothetical protein